MARSAGADHIPQAARGGVAPSHCPLAGAHHRTTAPEVEPRRRPWRPHPGRVPRSAIRAGVLLRLPFPSIVVAPVVGAFAAFLGYMTPSLWLQQRISQRRRQIERSLAEATDLLTLVVESGMSLDEGLLSITERFHNALGDEIGKVLREIRLGRPRMAALEHMAESTGV